VNRRSAPARHARPSSSPRPRTLHALLSWLTAGLMIAGVLAASPLSDPSSEWPSFATAASDKSAHGKADRKARAAARAHQQRSGTGGAAETQEASRRGRDAAPATEAAPTTEAAPGTEAVPTDEPRTGTGATDGGVELGSGTPSSDGILLSRAELMALPTSGAAWDAVMDRVAHPYGGSYVLATRDESNKDVLAHALAGARSNNQAYLAFARDKIQHMMEAPRDTGDVLGTLRHLQTYIISADLIDLASFDPALDARFRTWLAAEIRFDYAGGGSGGSVISIHERKPNNFGTHAGATRIAAALYLGDGAELKAARDVWYGWATGDPGYTDAAGAWTGTSWQCGDGHLYGINPMGCSREGVSLDGVIPEDQERCGEFSVQPCATNYIQGATDGMTLSFWMLARQGENPWAWGNQAALRQMEWKYSNDQAPYSGFRWQIPVIENAYGIDLPGNDPAMTSTNVGFADWWAH
jgi:hypothetical protein